MSGWDGWTAGYQRVDEELAQDAEQAGSWSCLHCNRLCRDDEYWCEACGWPDEDEMARTKLEAMREHQLELELEDERWAR